MIWFWSVKWMMGLVLVRCACVRVVCHIIKPLIKLTGLFLVTVVNLPTFLIFCHLALFFCHFYDAHLRYFQSDVWIPIHWWRRMNHFKFYKAPYIWIITMCVLRLHSLIYFKRQTIESRRFRLFLSHLVDTDRQSWYDLNIREKNLIFKNIHVITSFPGHFLVSMGRKRKGSWEQGCHGVTYLR